LFFYLWDNIKRSKSFVIGFSERERREYRAEILLEKTIPKNFPSIIKS
jgi:hypothetical protein